MIGTSERAVTLGFHPRDGCPKCLFFLEELGWGRGGRAPCLRGLEKMFVYSLVLLGLMRKGCVW